MKKLSFVVAPLLIGALGVLPLMSVAQDAQAPSKKELREKKKAQKDDYWTNFRNYDKSGVNVFEVPKEDPAAFDKVKVRIGAGFTQMFQRLEHQNSNSLGTNAGTPKLYQRMASGAGIAQANLFLDAMLAEGIQLNVTTYLSSHHHQETWVKGGYLQIDKLPFRNEFLDKLMKNVRIKAGHFGINYGDQQFRRSDGGHALYNPFMENYILDAFATEVGGEVYYLKNGFVGMIGVSNGLINGGVQTPITGTTTYKRNPSLYGKLAYDKTLDNDIRFRIAASGYYNKNVGRSTLFAGDRTGSNYLFVMEPEAASGTANAFAGRLNGLNFSQEVKAAQFNGFFKAGGLELFGTLETAAGRNQAEKNANFSARKVNQTAIDAVYRVGANENFFVGARYNAVKGQMITSNTAKQKIDRVAFAAGWFITPNVLMKGEYVVQNYKDFPLTDIRSEGKFKGYVIEAIVGF